MNNLKRLQFPIYSVIYYIKKINHVIMFGKPLVLVLDQLTGWSASKPATIVQALPQW